MGWCGAWAEVGAAVVPRRRAHAHAQQPTTPHAHPSGPITPRVSQDAKALEELKLKELKNGRLAMVAFIGFIGQHAATGKSPLGALAEHVANPWTANVATNGVSIPGL